MLLSTVELRVLNLGDIILIVRPISVCHHFWVCGIYYSNNSMQCHSTDPITFKKNGVGDSTTLHPDDFRSATLDSRL